MERNVYNYAASRRESNIARGGRGQSRQTKFRASGESRKSRFTKRRGGAMRYGCPFVEFQPCRSQSTECRGERVT